jgi:tape measure domain-containing protein
MATVETLRVEYASRIAAQAKADQDALLGMAKAMETVGDKGKVTDEVLKRSTQTYGRLVKDIDGVAAATTKLERAETAHATRVNVVMDAYRRGEITLAKAQQDIARLNANFEQTTNKIVASGKAIEERFTPPLQRSVAGMKSATDASRSFAEQTGQTTSAIRQMGMQQGGLVGAFATGGVFAVGMAAATAAVAAFGTAMRAIPVAGDAARASIARLSATVGDMGVASTVFDKLTASSRQTGIAVAESAGSFQRFSIAASDVGATNEQVLSLVAGLQKFAIVSGASVQETGAATQQLGQALASGVLQGDELRSILENMPLFAQSLARELGTSIGNLRTLGAEGKLTAEVVFPAMLRAVQGVDDVFGQMPVTMARAQQQFDVAAQSFLVHLDQALGFSEKLTRALQIAANMVDKIRGFAGGATGAERMAELVAGVATGSATVSAYDQAIQDARNANADPQAIAGLERTRNDAAAELRKFRDELGEINKEAVLRDEAEWEIASEKRLSAENAAHSKSVQELKRKYDSQYKIESEYTTELAKLDKARNTGAVSEVDYLKISTGLLK